MPILTRKLQQLDDYPLILRVLSASLPEDPGCSLWLHGRPQVTLRARLPPFGARMRRYGGRSSAEAAIFSVEKNKIAIISRDGER